MTALETPFDWRTFWADLLQGTGRALLTLDGSETAQAAMAGLDYFDAARDRRAQRQQRAADEDARDPRKTAGERASYVRAGPTWRAYEPAMSGRVQLAPASYIPAASQSLGMMIPDMRPQPISANPYDSIELPGQVNFLSARRP